MEQNKNFKRDKDVELFFDTGAQETKWRKDSLFNILCCRNLTSIDHPFHKGAFKLALDFVLIGGSVGKESSHNTVTWV